MNTTEPMRSNSNSSSSNPKKKPFAAAWLVLAAAACCCAAASAQDAPRVPLASDGDGTVYVHPNTTSTEKSLETRGAVIGVQRPDGGGAYGGMDTSGSRPTYSIGGSTGGDLSFSTGVHSDGKDNKGVKAGVTIRY